MVPDEAPAGCRTTMPSMFCLTLPPQLLTMSTASAAPGAGTTSRRLTGTCTSSPACADTTWCPTAKRCTKSSRCTSRRAWWTATPRLRSWWSPSTTLCSTWLRGSSHWTVIGEWYTQWACCWEAPNLRIKHKLSNNRFLEMVYWTLFSFSCFIFILTFFNKHLLCPIVSTCHT